jgi:hypothetical protein
MYDTFFADAVSYTYQPLDTPMRDFDGNYSITQRMVEQFAPMFSVDLFTQDQDTMLAVKDGLTYTFTRSTLPLLGDVFFTNDHGVRAMLTQATMHRSDDYSWWLQLLDPDTEGAVKFFLRDGG